jgi:predicted Ser/Thr protein kinase
MELPLHPNESSPASGDALPASSGGAFAASMTGRTFGNYQLLEEISRGSMGVVWKARQRDLNRLVALKAVSSGVLATSEDVARFRSEAEMVARIKHPNIISIFEIGQQDGCHFFTMDYIEGRSLESVADHQPQPPRAAAELVRTIANAVQFMHEHGVLHRDIKPLNIMLDASGQPVLLDFGLAKHLSDEGRLTQSGVVMGSPCYMAPEQAERGDYCVGPHTEVHALGITLYQLLTGTVPYSGATAEETLMNVARSTPKAPSELVPSIPRDLETIVLKCLEKSPLHRYTTARDLALDLERFLGGVPVLARRAKLGRRALTWVEHHPWTVAWTGIGVSSVMFGVAFGLWEKTRALAAKMTPLGEEAAPPLAEWLHITAFEYFTMIGSMIVSAVLIRASAYGLRPMEVVLQPERMTPRARRPVPGYIFKLSVFTALLGGLQGLRSFMGFIEHGVWFGAWRWEQFTLETYALGIWSLGLLGMVWRFYRAQHLGTPMPHEVSVLPPACQAAVNAAIFRGDRTHAVRLCREGTAMDRSTANRCVRGLDRHLRDVHAEKFEKAGRAPAALTDYVGAVIAVCAFIPVAAMFLAGQGWQHATLAALLGLILGIAIMDMENWLRQPWHHAVMFLTCAAVLARAVILKVEHELPDDLYLWLASGILAGGVIVAAATRGRPGAAHDPVESRVART